MGDWPRGLSPVLSITQSNHLTHGAVIHADARGCLVLTCRHHRNPADPWRAGPLSGRYTLLDSHADLALLWTAQRWTGPVLAIADKAPEVQVRFCHGLGVRAAFPFGAPHYEYPTPAPKGYSGYPLLVGGRVAGVLVGPSAEGGSLWTTQGAVMRFLKEVGR